VIDGPQEDKTSYKSELLIADKYSWATSNADV